MLTLRMVSILLWLRDIPKNGCGGDSLITLNCDD